MTALSAANARRLANFINALNGFEIRHRAGPCYAHMGATICDAVLQAGLNYRTVVAPRVNRLTSRWSSAITTSRFLAMIARYGLNEVLKWSHPEKLTRIRQLTEFLVARKLETENELSSWLSMESNAEMLQDVRGIGPKTRDYLKSLVGVPAVAVDRHVRTFVNRAGIEASDYTEISNLVCAAADLLSVEPHTLDHAIWSYVAAERRARQAA